MRGANSGKGLGFELTLRFPEGLATGEFSGAEVCRMIIEGFERGLKKYSRNAEIIETYYKGGSNAHSECGIVFRVGDKKGRLTARIGVGAKSLNIEFTAL